MPLYREDQSSVRSLKTVSPDAPAPTKVIKRRECSGARKGDPLPALALYEQELLRKLRISEYERNSLLTQLGKADVQAEELRRASNSAAMARDAMAGEVRFMQVEMERLRYHFDGVVTSKAWRITKPLRWARNIVGDLQSRCRLAPIYLRVQPKQPLDPHEQGAGRTIAFQLTPLGRQFSRGWVRLRTHAASPMFRGPVRLYFDIGGGFIEQHCLCIDTDKNGDFDVLCKLPRHVLAMELHAEATATPWGEIVAHHTVGIGGFLTILRQELLSTSP